MSPTAKYFLKDVSKKIELLLVGDGTQDIADIYYAEPVADKVKIGIDHVL